MRQSSFSVLGVVCLMLAATWLAAGCGREEAPGRPKPEPPPEKKQAQEMPEIPGTDDEKSGKADVLVKSTDVLTKYAKPLYEQDETVPAGALSGICFVRLEGGGQLPARPLIDPQKGPFAIRAPLPGEVDYFRKAALRRPRWIRYNEGTRRHLVIGAAIIIRGIKVGRRKPQQSRAVVNTFNGRLIRYGEFGASSGSIKFTALNDRLVFRVWDPFPCHFVMTELDSGKPVFDTKMAGYHAKERMAKTEGWQSPYTTFGHGVLAPHTQSPPLKEIKTYKIVCRRHPWQVAYAFVVKNPYVVVSGPRAFTLAGVPVGKWTVEVWHPALEPVQRTFEVEIKKNETTEVGVEFKLPPWLRATSKKTE